MKVTAAMRKELKQMTTIQDLKRFNADTTDLETMVVLAAEARGLTAEFDHQNIPHPEWLDDVNRRLKNAIATQTKEAKEARLREIRARQTQLMTQSEQRAALANEAAALEKELLGTK